MQLTGLQRLPLRLGLLLVLFSTASHARIDYINDRVNPALGIVEAKGTCNHSRTTPFPGQPWRVMKIAGETSYQGPADQGRAFIDKPIEEWEMALCQISQRSVKELLRDRL
jgi:hypothetical protein